MKLFTKQFVNQFKTVQLQWVCYSNQFDFEEPWKQPFTTSLSAPFLIQIVLVRFQTTWNNFEVKKRLTKGATINTDRNEITCGKFNVQNAAASYYNIWVRCTASDSAPPARETALSAPTRVCNRRCLVFICQKCDTWRAAYQQ